MVTSCSRRRSTLAVKCACPACKTVLVVPDPNPSVPAAVPVPVAVVSPVPALPAPVKSSPPPLPPSVNPLPPPLPVAIAQGPPPSPQALDQLEVVDQLEVLPNEPIPAQLDELEPLDDEDFGPRKRKMKIKERCAGQTWGSAFTMAKCSAYCSRSL